MKIFLSLIAIFCCYFQVNAEEKEITPYVCLYPEEIYLSKDGIIVGIGENVYSVQGIRHVGDGKYEFDKMEHICYRKERLYTIKPSE
jgi:hypothetical protein